MKFNRDPKELTLVAAMILLVIAQTALILWQMAT